MLTRQKDEDRRGRQESVNLGSIVENDAGEEEDKDDEDTGDAGEIYLGGRTRERARLRLTSVSSNCVPV